MVPATGSRWNSCGVEKSFSGDHGGRGNQKPLWGSSALALGLGAALFLHHSEKKNLLAEESNAKTTVVLGERKEGLPEFTMEEVGGILMVKSVTLYHHRLERIPAERSRGNSLPSPSGGLVM